MSRHGMVFLLTAVLAVVPMAGCAKAPRSRPVKMGDVDTGKGTLTAARKYLEGRWSLLSYEVYPPNADPISLKGEGTLTYDDFSNLDIQIRTDAGTAALLDKAGIKNDAGTISTSGRVVVDMVKHTLTYVVEGQPKVGEPGGPLALNRPRYWEVAGNVLTLTTRGDDGKPLSVGKWQKME